MLENDVELEFYRAVEDFFATVRGVPHLLSPKDFQLLRSWWRDRVPLAAVTGGISEVFARRRDQGEDDPVVSLAYCRHAVARHAKRLAEMRAGAHPEEAAAGAAATRHSPLALATALRSTAAKLTGELLTVAGAILKVADLVEAGVDLPPAVLEERLFALESVLLAGCWRDQTNVFGGEQGIPIGRELTKVAGECFSQAFGTVSSFREPPAAGQYDLTAIIQVKKVDVFDYMNINPLFTPDKGSVEVMLNWDLSVVDRKGVEQFSHKGITPPEKFPVQSSSNADWFFDGLGNACSKLVSRLAKELALSMYSSPEVRTHVQGG